MKKFDESKALLMASASTTSQRDLLKLSRHSNPFIRLGVVKNPVTSKKIIRQMTQDDNRMVREEARRIITPQAGFGQRG